MMRSGTTSSAQASIDTNPSTLLRLLMIRELCDVDPAPEFPGCALLPQSIRDRYPRISHDITAQWRSHWSAAVTELAPSAPPESGAWTPWPSDLPQPTTEDIAAWGVTIRRPPRGTSLDEYPSHRYYLARSSEPDVLPERIVVLPFAGQYTGRFSDDIGYLSTDTYLHPQDALYGFFVA